MLVARKGCLPAMDHVKRYYGGLPWPTNLRVRSKGVFGAVAICAGLRGESSSGLCYLSYSMIARDRDEKATLYTLASQNNGLSLQ